MKKRWLWCLVVGILWMGGCTGITIPEPTEADSPCVADFDPAVDYFPDKSRITHATGFTIEYFSHYKVVDVTRPWPGAEEAETYLLVQCGTPVPAGFAHATVIEVPIRSLVALSSSYLPALELLDQIPLLVGLGSDWTVYSEAVRQRVAEGAISLVGFGHTVDVEQILVLNPDLVMTYSLGAPEGDAHPVLRAANQTVLLNGEWLEHTPLGRAEWLKLTAVLLNREQEANAYFAEAVGQYEQLRALVTQETDRPTVFLNTPWEGVWYMAGGQGYVATLLQDAGGHYLWSDHEGTSSLFLDFEQVYERAHDADYWLNVGQMADREALLAADARFAQFAAYQTEAIFNDDRRLSPAGANDIWEGAVIRPHVVLADLMAIFHPHLLPEHEFVYYRQLE